MEEKQKKEIRNKSKDNSRNLKFISFDDVCYFPEESKIVRKVKGKDKGKKLPNKQALILDCLIEAKGRKVNRHDIVDKVWKNVNCTEKNFYKAIDILRRELAEEGQPWRYIINPSTNYFALKPKVKFHYEFTRSDFYKIAKQFIAVSILGATVTVAAMKTHFMPFYQSTNYKSVTNLKGEVERAATSPDGSIVVFTHKPVGATGWNLLAKKVGTEEQRILVNDQNNNTYNTEPSFSPSGTRIAWIKTDYHTHCAVFVADIDPSDLSLSNKNIVVDCSQQNFGRTPQWRNEDSLLVSLSQGVRKPNGIVEINLTTRELSTITSPSRVESEYGDIGLFFNQAANKLCYLRQSTKSGIGSELRIFDFSSNTDSVLKVYPHYLYSVAWVNADSILAKGDKGFEIINLDGQAHTVHSDKLEPQSFPFSMGINQIGFVRGYLAGNDIAVVDLATEIEDSRLSSVAHDYKAVIAKDANAIAFLSFRSNKHRLFVTKDNALTEVTEFTEQARIYDMAISPDGQLVAFVLGSQLTIVNNLGKLLYKKNAALEGLSFTSDNQSLVFGVREEGMARVKRLSIRDLKETLIADGFMPKATENGDIYFFNLLGDASTPVLHKITEQGEITALFEAPFPVMNMNSNAFDIADDKLYYVTTKSKDTNAKVLVSKNLDNGELSTITQIESNYFSINRSATTVVTTKKGNVQNNLASFEITNEF